MQAISTSSVSGIAQLVKGFCEQQMFVILVC